MESSELQSVDEFSSMIHATLSDAMARLAAMRPAGADPIGLAACDVFSFRQTWPDASCGFGGIAAQVLTDAQTVVVSWREGAIAMVFIRGEHAYTLRQPSERFWAAVRDHRLPGANGPLDELGQPA